MMHSENSCKIENRATMKRTGSSIRPTRRTRYAENPNTMSWKSDTTRPLKGARGELHEWSY